MDGDGANTERECDRQEQKQEGAAVSDRKSWTKMGHESEAGMVGEGRKTEAHEGAIKDRKCRLPTKKGREDRGS